MEFRNILHSRLSKTLFFFLLLGIIVISQYYFDIKKSGRPANPTAIIPAPIIKLGNLGLDSASAALLWVYSIQSFTTHPQEMPKLIRTVTELDPRFSYPYAFATLTLPDLGFIEEGLEIGLRGLREADPDWRIPYYLATTYHIHLKDRKNAALNFDIAARTPGAPEQVSRIASRYGSSANAREQTKEVWASIYETTNDETVRERAKNYLLQVEILELLERSVEIYKNKFGVKPKKIEDLVRPGILKAIPPNPFGLKYSVTEDGKIMVGN